MKTRIETEDDDQVARDGERVIVQLHLMDTQQRILATHAQIMGSAANLLHRPGYAPMTDAQRQRIADAYDRSDEKLSMRWRNPPAIDAAKRTQGQHTPALANDDRAAMYGAADNKLSQRWRGTA